MPNDALLNRYWDAKNTPRDEAYAEDRATLASAPNRPAGLLARDLRAAAESGWDFSSRWFADGRTLASIHTTDIAPVDLNSLLWTMERAIARRCAALSESACAHEFDARSQARRATMQTYLWSPQAQRFGDWDLEAQAPTPAVTAALLFPLFTGWASPKQAARTLNLLRESLLGPGGVRTSLVRTGQQWDAPNGWAPLQWVAAAGADRYGGAALARTIATRWIATVDAFYRRTGRVIEKYDVEASSAGGGGEYLVQDGFGWTNGVVSAFCARYQVSESECGRLAPDAP